MYQGIRAAVKWRNGQARGAEARSVSLGDVSRIERGAARVNLDTLAAVAARLDCDLAQLVTGVSIRQKRFKGGAEQLVERMDGGQRHLLLASG